MKCILNHHHYIQFYVVFYVDLVLSFSRILSSKLNTNEYIHYLKTKAKYIDNKEHIVILQLDEVYTKEVIVS